MGEQKRTAGRWTAKGAEVRAPSRRVADCDDHAPYVIDREGIANAAFIAEACNAYEDVRAVMTDRGWLNPESPPLPESIGIMLDLLESLQRSQSALRLELHRLQESSGAVLHK